MGSGLSKFKRKAPEKAPDENKQDIFTLPVVHRYSLGHSYTDSGYMNIGDVVRNNGTQIITIPLDSAPSSQDDSEETQYMNIGLVATSCNDNTSETGVRHETDVRQEKADTQINENVIVDDVHSDGEESDYQSLNDSGCGSTHSTGAINQTCVNLKENENIPIKSVISKEDPISLLPKMAEVFRPLIVDSILVSEILPYMSLQVDKGKLQCMEKGSTKEAASLLLDEIIASQEPGKWTMFLDALKEAGYEHVSRILMGETETDFYVHRKLLQIFTPHIVDNLYPRELTDILFAKDLISIADKEEIENTQRNKNTSAATLVLLDRIPRRKDNWFSEFVVALRDCGHEFVAEEISIQEECSPSAICKDVQYTSALKPKPCTNRPVTGAAHQKSASDEESRCRGALCEEDKIDADEEEKQLIKEKQRLMKTRDEKQRKAQHNKEIEDLKQEIKELENDELEREEINRQEALRQEKESLVKMLDQKNKSAKIQQEIDQLRKTMTEVENASDNLQEADSSDEKNEGHNPVKNSRYVEIDGSEQTSQFFVRKAELENIIKELLNREIVPNMITTIRSEIFQALQQLNDENNLDYSEVMEDLKSFNFESLQPATATVFQNETLSMEAMKDIEHDYDVAT